MKKKEIIGKIMKEAFDKETVLTQAGVILGTIVLDIALATCIVLSEEKNEGSK